LLKRKLIQRRYVATSMGAPTGVVVGVFALAIDD
jgi:hypothetical protein